MDNTLAHGCHLGVNWVSIGCQLGFKLVSFGCHLGDYLERTSAQWAAYMAIFIMININYIIFYHDHPQHHLTININVTDPGNPVELFVRALALARFLIE